MSQKGESFKMKLISLDRVNQLLKEPPIEKHLNEFKDCKYPEVWYGIWIRGIIDALRYRQQRTQGGSDGKTKAE